MGKRLTTQYFVSEARKVHESKYDYSKSVYTTAKNKVVIICDVHGPFEQVPYSHLKGHGCIRCAAKDLADSRSNKVADEYLDRVRVVHGDQYDLSKVVYTTAKAIVTPICPVHGKFEISAYEFSKGAHCQKCSYLDYRKDRANSLDDFIQKSKSIHGDFYDYSAVEYYNSKTKVSIRCPLHGIFEQIPNSHLRGVDCPKCGKEKAARNKTWSWERLVERFNEVHGGRYSYPEQAYKNQSQKVEIICTVHGSFSQLVANHLRGAGCARCQHENNAISLTCSYDDFVVKARSVHGDLYEYPESGFAKSHDKMSIICKTHGEFKQTGANHLRNHGCPVCSPCYSKAEIEISEWLDTIGITPITKRDRSIIAPRELDIVLHQHNLAIEYCGIYWHSESNGKDRKYHISKMNDCLSKGYNLITVFEDEWNTHQQVVKSRLSHMLNKIGDSVFARKCQVRVISSKESSLFLDQNHLQKADIASVRLGLYHNNELVSVMTFCTPRFSKNYQWEMSRYCSKINTSVIGGAGKLFSYFKNHYNPFSVVSYADKRWGIGNFYQHLGFNHTHDSDPNYWYINTAKSSIKRESRVKYQKHKLVQEGFDPSKSEWQIMQERGYDRIWDCGNAVWIWNS